LRERRERQGCADSGHSPGCCQSPKLGDPAAPTQPNATVWGLATHPADPNRIVAFSLFGEVYVSEDAGASWRKIAREFGEIRAAV
jgi:hypothetical protein